MYEYRGIAYRQSLDPAAPLLITFVAPAEELLLWAGIPRRAEVNMAGFQRDIDKDRIARAKEFFRLGENQSPTALVVGIHPVADGAKRAVELVFPSGKDSDPIRECILRVNFDVANTKDAAIIDRVRRQIDYRLAQNPDTEIDDRAGDDEDEEVDIAASAESGTDTANDDEEEEDEEIELGRSMLSLLRQKLDDSAWCAENREALFDIAKPATIIDGQHRVLGAQQCERNIPFTVCALFDCSWAEQVFQFTVVNYTQKGIPDQFITANAALSLTGAELELLRDRLVQAHVQVLEYELMKVVNFDERSPFYNLVNLTERAQRERIGYKTMVRIAKKWYNGMTPDIRKILLPNLFPEIRGRSASATRRAKWKDEVWGLFFTDFWTVVKDHFAGAPSAEPGHSLWEVGYSNLMVAIVLHDLQEQFFINLGEQDDEFWEVKEDNRVEALRQKMRKRASTFVSFFPAAFFAAKWGMTSLNTGGERKALESALEKLRKSKSRSNWSQFSVVTGESN